VGHKSVPEKQWIKATTGNDGPTRQQGRKDIPHYTACWVEKEGKM